MNWPVGTDCFGQESDQEFMALLLALSGICLQEYLTLMPTPPAGTVTSILSQVEQFLLSQG